MSVNTYCTVLAIVVYGRCDTDTLDYSVIIQPYLEQCQVVLIPVSIRLIRLAGFKYVLLILFTDIDNHKVVKVKLSLPIVHDLHSHEPIPWKVSYPQILSYVYTPCCLCHPQQGLLIRPTNMTSSELKKTVEKYSRIIKSSTN